MREPYLWQKKAFDLFKDAKAFMINAACGTGKTFSAIQIALYKKLPVIVIAPKNLCKTWQEELEENGICGKDVWVYDQPTYSKDKNRYEKDFMAWLNA